MKQAYKEAMAGQWITEASTDTQYAFKETNDTLVVAFQGSTSSLDRLQNLDFFVKPYRNMEHLFFVHRGFKKKYKSVRDHIIPRIRTAVVVGKKIEIRGYSQGAAIAMLCHEDAYFNTGVQPDTIVFGCPRVFAFWNFKLLNKRLDKITRVENGGDIVTGLPMWWLGFKHFGKMIYIGKKKIFKLSVKDHMEYKKELE